MEAFRLQIITPEREVLYQGEITMVEYNTTEGQVGVLKGHIPMTQVIAPGKLTIYETNSEEPKVAALMAGFVQILPDLITVLAEVIEWKDEIDLQRAEDSKKRAERLIAEHLSSTDIKRAELSLKRALVRISVKSE